MRETLILTNKSEEEIFGNLWKSNGENMAYECSICGSTHIVFPYGSNEKFFCIGSLTGISSVSINQISYKEKKSWEMYGSSRYHKTWEMEPREIKSEEKFL